MLRDEDDVQAVKYVLNEFENCTMARYTSGVSATPNIRSAACSMGLLALYRWLRSTSAYFRLKENDIVESNETITPMPVVLYLFLLRYICKSKAEVQELYPYLYQMIEAITSRLPTR